MQRFDPTYNTLMAVAAGLTLLMLVALGRRLDQGRPIHRQGWAAAFMALGVVLTLLGAVMTVTWPLSGPTAFDNIVFGEPSLALGVILIVGSALLGGGRFWQDSGTGASQELTADSWPHLSRLLQPLSWFGCAMGLALIAIAFIGPVYAPWEAPPSEPISGEFANYPALENAFISAIFALTAVGALLLPRALGRPSFTRARGVLKVVGVCWGLSGTAFLVFGAMNYYTHIGLTINTYNQSQKQAK